MSRTKLYFIDHHGNAKEYFKVEPEDYKNTAPCKGCDLLIEDEHGHRYSGDSKSYLESKREALEQERSRQLEGIAVYEHTLQTYKDALSKIEAELKEIENNGQQ